MIVSTFNHLMHDGSNGDYGDPKPKSNFFKERLDSFVRGHYREVYQGE